MRPSEIQTQGSKGQVTQTTQAEEIFGRAESLLGLIYDAIDADADTAPAVAFADFTVIDITPIALAALAGAEDLDEIAERIADAIAGKLGAEYIEIELDERVYKLYITPDVVRYLVEGYADILSDLYENILYEAEDRRDLFLEDDDHYRRLEREIVARVADLIASLAENAPIRVRVVGFNKRNKLDHEIAELAHLRAMRVVRGLHSAENLDDVVLVLHLADENARVLARDTAESINFRIVRGRRTRKFVTFFNEIVRDARRGTLAGDYLTIFYRRYSKYRRSFIVRIMPEFIYDF